MNTKIIIISNKLYSNILLINDIKSIVISRLSLLNKNVNLVLYVNKFLNTVLIKKKSIYKSINITSVLNDFNSIRYFKIVFSGKGYKLDTINNKYYFFFNYSHLLVLFIRKMVHLRIKKNKILFFRVNSSNNSIFINSIKNIRKINKYTQKGIKISRSLFFTRNKKKK